MGSKWRGRVALVTGSSHGIGLAIARSLAQLGMIVIGCARNIENIKKLGDEFPNGCGSVNAIRCDVTKENEILTMFAQIKERFGGVDVCVNNAGILNPCSLLDGATDGWKEMMKVNIIGLCVCTREAVKSMRERKIDDGHIIHMNSTSGHRVRPSSASHFYAATNHAVTALTEGLRQELREINSHIRITVENTF